MNASENDLDFRLGEIGLKYGLEMVTCKHPSGDVHTIPDWREWPNGMLAEVVKIAVRIVGDESDSWMAMERPGDLEAWTKLREEMADKIEVIANPPLRPMPSTDIQIIEDDVWEAITNPMLIPGATPVPPDIELAVNRAIAEGGPMTAADIEVMNENVRKLKAERKQRLREFKEKLDAGEGDLNV